MNDDPAPFYAMLRVDEAASTQEIETQFRRLVKQYHPDQGGSEDAYLRLQTARETLCSPAERRRYDRLGHDTYVKTTGAKRWIAWDKTQSSEPSDDPTADTTTQTETEQGDRQEASSTNSTTGATNAGRQRSADNQGSTSTASKSRSYSRTDSASASDRKTEGTQTTGRSTDETTEENTAAAAGSNRDTRHPSDSSQRASAQASGSNRDKTANTSTSSGFVVPRVLVVLVIAYSILIPLQILSEISVSTLSSTAVGFALVVVFGNELRVYSQQTESIDPQLSPRYAGYIAVCSGIGAGLMAIAVSHGSLNGGLLLGRFVLLFYIGLFVPVGVVVFGVCYIGGNMNLYAGGVSTIIVLVGLFLIEFTPYRFWFPFTALATEPASTIAPWVDVGAASGFTVWWAVNIVLALLMSITLCIGIGTLLGLFSALLRGDNTNKTGHRIVGWELLASVPFALLGWWHLAGNRLWVLHGIPPESTVAAGLILAVCCWPTVVFGAYSLVEQS